MDKPYIVAELSANHLGKLDRALGLVNAAARAGADAIKLQTFEPEAMAIPYYTIQSGPWKNKCLIELYRQAQTPRNWHKPIFKFAHELGIEAFSSTYDLDGLDFLESIGCPRYKISSFEILDTELINAAARTGKPLIISTGMATFNEIRSAVYAARGGGCQDLTLLACISAYPATATPGILHLMDNLGYHFACKIGISDHTLGLGLAVAASAFGADVIEKHLTLKRKDNGPDAAFSAEPDEFAEMVSECRAVKDLTIGCVEFGPCEQEMPQLALRRSLWWASDVKVGQTITRDMITALRPSGGLSPALIHMVTGRKLANDVKQWQPVKLEDLVYNYGYKRMEGNLSN